MDFFCNERRFLNYNSCKNSGWTYFLFLCELNNRGEKSVWRLESATYSCTCVVFNWRRLYKRQTQSPCRMRRRVVISVRIADIGSSRQRIARNVLNRTSASKRLKGTKKKKYWHIKTDNNRGDSKHAENFKLKLCLFFKRKKGKFFTIHILINR